jgi:hypothetical protein
MCYILLYQPWIGRFLGFSYVSLIPIASFVIVQSKSENKIFRKMREVGINAKYSIIGMLFLVFVMHVGRSALANDMKIGFSSRFASIPLNQRIYAEHLSEHKMVRSSRIIRLLNHIEEASYDERIICAEGDSWVLTPLIVSLKNKSYTGNNLYTSPMAKCKSIINSTSGMKEYFDDAKMDGINVYKKNGKEFVLLP